MARRSITTRLVRDAERHVGKLGPRRCLRRLEVTEPQLASYLMEEGTRLYTDLDVACRSYADVQVIHKRFMRLTLVCIESLRKATR